jgi:hypothetical protein
MPVIPKLIKRLNTKRISQIEYIKRHPADTQKAVLSDILAKASDTHWGFKYNYASIKSADEYRLTVPIQTYEKIIPMIERLRAGGSALAGRNQMVCKIIRDYLIKKQIHTCKPGCPGAMPLPGGQRCSCFIYP